MNRIQLLADLESVRQNLLEMCQTTLALVDEAVCNILEPHSDHSASVSELEAQRNHQHRLIQASCLHLITRQESVGNNGRFLTGVLDATLGLESIGSYSNEIVTLASAKRRRPPSHLLAQMSEVAKNVREVFAEAIDAWWGKYPVKESSGHIIEPGTGSCGALYEQLAQLMWRSGETKAYLDLVIVRYLESILSRAVCVGDLAMVAAVDREAQVAIAEAN